MLNLYASQIESVSLHRVGNQHRGEPLFLSENPYELNDEISGLLKEYFFKPFREKEENYYRKETSLGKFERTFTLPVDVDSNQIKAEYKDGLLKIEIPKPEGQKPKQISIH